MYVCTDIQIITCFNYYDMLLCNNIIAKEQLLSFITIINKHNSRIGLNFIYVICSVNDRVHPVCE